MGLKVSIFQGICHWHLHWLHISWQLPLPFFFPSFSFLALHSILISSFVYPIRYHAFHHTSRWPGMPGGKIPSPFFVIGTCSWASVEIRITIYGEKLRKMRKKKEHTDLIWFDKLSISTETEKKTFTTYQIKLDILTLRNEILKILLNHTTGCCPPHPQPIINHNNRNTSLNATTIKIQV